MNYDTLANELCKLLKGKAGRQVINLLGEGFMGMYAILHIIRDSNSKVMPIDIANKLDISTARVAAALNSLSEKNYVVRQPASPDSRNVIVEITPLGLQALNERELKVHNFIVTFLQKLTEDEAHTFIALGKKLLS